MGRPKKGPPLIRSDYFTEESDLTVDELRAISISTLADIPTFLTAVNWNGGAYAVIALRLSPDNQRVLSGTCALVGNLFTGKVINCNLFWQPVIATKLTLSIPSLNIFNFPDGKLVSDYLPSSAFPHEFSHNDAVITEDDYPATGISSFVLRAFVSPSTDAFVKIIILLYPCSEETLLSLYPLYKDPRFPGLKLCSFDFPLGPPCSAGPIRRLWGFPIFPAIIPGSPWSDSGTLPSGAALRHALSSILGSAVAPEVKLNLQTLNLRCQEILSKGALALKLNLPPVIWPSSNPAPALGWCCFFFSFLLLFFYFFLFSMFFLALPFRTFSLFLVFVT